MKYCRPIALEGRFYEFLSVFCACFEFSARFSPRPPPFSFPIDTSRRCALDLIFTVP